MKTHNLLALTASAVITLTGLFALNSPVQVQPVSEINGIRVVNLAPVHVSPSVDDLRAADQLGTTDLTSALLVGNGNNSAALLGAQLAMPYYSFGTKLGHSSKE